MIKLQQRKRQLDIFWLLMGGVASIVGLALLVPFADSLLWHEEKSWAFLVPAVLSLALGLLLGAIVFLLNYCFILYPPEAGPV